MADEPVLPTPDTIAELFARKPPLDKDALRAIVAKFRQDRHHMGTAVSRAKAEKPPKEPKAKKAPKVKAAKAESLMDLFSDEGGENGGSGI